MANIEHRNFDTVDDLNIQRINVIKRNRMTLDDHDYRRYNALRINGNIPNDLDANIIDNYNIKHPRNTFANVNSHRYLSGNNYQNTNFPNQRFYDINDKTPYFANNISNKNIVTNNIKEFFHDKMRYGSVEKNNNYFATNKKNNDNYLEDSKSQVKHTNYDYYERKEE